MHQSRPATPVPRASAVLALAAILLAFTSPTRAADTPPYKNPTLPFEQRVADLVSRMSIQQKIDQLQVGQPAIPELGVPACRWGMEALHGLAGGTIYPDGVALGAMWDPALLHRIASAIGDEARSRAGTPPIQGVILWCPTVNMVRDPRWGRNEETYGEDPYLSGRLGAAFCSGLQGDDPKYLKTIASPKHFTVYSQEASRQSVDARVSERALREYYLPPFEACFTEGHAMSTMSAYNAINGIPCSANDWLLTSVLRGEWKFPGAVVTDANAANMIYTAHRYTDSEEKALAAAINAGVDLITGGGGGRGMGGGGNVSALLMTAYQNGLLKDDVIDRAVTRSFLIRFRLGQFDPPEMVSFNHISSAIVGSKEHAELALQASRESTVLLKNDPAPKGFGFDKLLPLDLRRINSIAVLGTYATANQLGSYNTNNPNSIFSRGVTPLEAIKAAVGDRIIVRTEIGADTDRSAEAARLSDIAIVFVGLDGRTERAGTDRRDIELPYDQRSLIDRVVKANPLTILVLEGGSCIGVEPFKDKFPAILMHWYAGEQGGAAIADILTGQYNPSGRLPITFYRSIDDLPPMDDYELVTGRTYLYCKKPVSYPFGHGLSYTTFSYANFHITPPAGNSTSLDGSLSASADITNTGPFDGDEVVQLYFHQRDPSLTRPIKQLIGFQRLSIPKGQTRSVNFTIPAKSLAYWDTEHHQFTIDPGAYDFMLAASSEDIRSKDSLELK